MTIDRQHGAVLVLVTWVLAVIAVAAFGISRNTRGAVNVATAEVRITQARAAAEAGIWRGVFELLKPSDTDPWRTDGAPYEVDVAGAVVTVAIQDQTGLVDINAASTDVLKILLSAVSDLDVDGDAIVDAILDWRDRDSLKRPLGAEDSDYESADYDYGAKDAPFNVKEELQQVAGVSRDFYRGIAAYITVHGQNQRIGLKSAPPHTLAIVPGLTSSDTEAIATAQEDDSTTGLGSVVARTGKTLVRSQGGNSFEIQSQAVYKGVSQRMSAIVLIDRRSRRGYQILAWRTDFDPPPEVTLDDETEA